ncbi:MAG: nucleotidyltransferase domain-containing protein [candidate division KSB1 bacterium]|nr:nucleotidyltransferase domain-containing protein [candidate division KSB1 bacterium]MDZ7341310.1 nucleotidyltransferase domain-containing protein [candidate division KSB1 bacterium]
MAKIPKEPQTIFEEFTNDFKNIYGEDLIAIILYGSAARGEYIYKKSDINFLVVLSEAGIQRLRAALLLIPKWQKRRVATPLVLTESYIDSALDSYPIEFMTMKQHYQVVYGRDVLADIHIAPEYLRLQCERELRGKLLHLREGYLNTRGRAKAIKSLIRSSIPAFASIFAALLHLKHVDIPPRMHQLFSKTAEVFDLDEILFKKILTFKEDNIKSSSLQLNELFENYIEQIRKLIRAVDQLNS